MLVSWAIVLLGAAIVPVLAHYFDHGKSSMLWASVSHVCALIALRNPGTVKSRRTMCGWCTPGKTNSTLNTAMTSIIAARQL